MAPQCGPLWIIQRLPITIFLLFICFLCVFPQSGWRREKRKPREAEDKFAQELNCWRNGHIVDSLWIYQLWILHFLFVFHFVHCQAVHYHVSLANSSCFPPLFVALTSSELRSMPEAWIFLLLWLKNSVFQEKSVIMETENDDIFTYYYHTLIMCSVCWQER